jgi:hypothetical protein
MEQEPKPKKVGIRCSEAFASRIESERIRLGMSGSRHMVTTALEYFLGWKGLNRSPSGSDCEKYTNVSRFWQTGREEETCCGTLPRLRRSFRQRGWSYWLNR